MRELGREGGEGRVGRWVCDRGAVNNGVSFRSDTGGEGGELELGFEVCVKGAGKEGGREGREGGGRERRAKVKRGGVCDRGSGDNGSV